MKNDISNSGIEVRNLSKYFHNKGNKITVLEDVNFKIGDGEVIAIMGPSGIGKSTLLSLMGTLDKPDSGTVLYNGKNPFTLSEKEMAKFRNNKIGFVFQFHHLLPEFTALENVLIPSYIYKNDISAGKKLAEQMLKRVGLSERLSHRPSELSGGERQRVAVARALINNPQVILADEPSGNLDMDNSKMLIDLLLELNEKYKGTFVIATHNPAIAERTHRVLNLEKGRVV